MAWLSASAVLLWMAGCTSAELSPASQDAGMPDANMTADGGANTDGGIGVTPSVAGQLVISEIMFDSVAITDDCGEWFELYNPSATVTYDLYGCQFGDAASLSTITGHLIIQPGQYVSLTRYDQTPGTCDLTSPPGFNFDYYYGPTIKFGNQVADHDAVRVVCNTTLIDEVNYSSFDTTGTDAYLLTFKGRAMSLDPSALDAASNDVKTNWCPAVNAFRTFTGSTDYGTPSAPNPSCN